ncbi:hypothetical protein [Sphingobacterium lactis]|uniref:hypothetical protein n=1 Tax=Sphingobacterium lactis TaxID=797291 RepID=UPI003DA6ADD1
MNSNRTPKIWYPFEHTTTQRLMLWGVLGFILHVLLSWLWDVNQDALLHFAESKPKAWWKILYNNSLNITALTVVLYVYGRIVYKKTRWIDVLVAILFSHIFLFLSLVVTLNPYMAEISGQVVDMVKNGDLEVEKLGAFSLAMMSITGLLGIFFLVVFFYYLIQGMKIAINSKKWYHGLVIVLLVFMVDLLLRIIHVYL